MGSISALTDAYEMLQRSDHSLLRCLHGGDQNAATELYLRYAHRVRLLARAKSSADLARIVDADDIVQSVFSSFFRGAQQGYYDVPRGEEIWRILLVIALNKIRAKGSFHHAAKRDIRLTTASEAINSALGPAHKADHTAFVFLQMAIDETLETLPALEKQMVILRIEGFEVAEIAAQTQRSKRTVERVLQEFRQHLAKALQEEP